MLYEKEFSFCAEKAMPVEEALGVINKLALEPVEADSVYIGKMRLANSQVDRSFEKFPVPMLEQFARTLPGKPVLEGHDKTKSPSGRFFGASLAKDADGVTHLMGDYYLPANSDLAGRVKMGIASGVSLGFQAAGRTCDLCGQKIETCPHQPGHEYEGKLATVTYSGDAAKYEAMEGSFVWVGCQYGAQALGVKMWPGGGFLLTDRSPGDPAGVWTFPGVPGEDAMEKAELEARVKALETENAALAGSNTELKAATAFALEGKQYRTDLTTEIARKLGVLERPSEQMIKLLESADVATLKGLDEGLQAEINLKFPPAPQSKMLGQPNGAALVPGAGDTDAGGEPITLEKFLEKRIRGGTFNNWTEGAE